MKKLIFLFALVFCNLANAQIPFDKLPRKVQEELMTYAADFANMPLSSVYLAITPDGSIWNKSNYRPPQIAADTVRYDGTEKTAFLYRSLKPLEEERYIYLYNDNTAIVHGIVEVTAEVKGQPVTYRVARLETHVKVNGKWQMACGSGTLIDGPYSFQEKLLVGGQK